MLFIRVCTTTVTYVGITLCVQYYRTAVHSSVPADKSQCVTVDCSAAAPTDMRRHNCATASNMSYVAAHNYTVCHPAWETKQCKARYKDNKYSTIVASHGCRWQINLHVCVSRWRFSINLSTYRHPLRKKLRPPPLCELLRGRPYHDLAATTKKENPYSTQYAYSRRHKVWRAVRRRRNTTTTEMTALQMRRNATERRRGCLRSYATATETTFRKWLYTVYSNTH